uniref:S-acyltransferase n=1 Tax=Anthurium amnicola TaxID=1678845 RepID=A0A1D1YZN6_9ARAE
MRKHGWQLPYHPLQVVAIAVFLALGFAFYVFFVPFVGEKQYQYVVMGIYTPLVGCVFCLYIWCAAADPGDPGVFKSKKYLNIVDLGKHTDSKEFRQEGESISSMNEANTATVGDKPLNGAHAPDASDRKSSNELVEEKASCFIIPFFLVLLGCCSLSSGCSKPHSREQSGEQQMSEDGMFYCSLCEVEVYKYSKHCRVCDKCVDGFDHHCRWLNNCIGRKNYRRFFILMISALLLLIVQCSIGVLVLIRCLLERRRFTVDIASKLGSSFSLVPFVVVVVSCTFLAMVATLPLAQLFFFHVLLIKKGISTYDYIIALREQEQQGVGGQQSPQMSPVSSLTGLSSASSFTTFHRGAWCTPPRLFLEDQFDVVPPDAGSSVSALRKRMLIEESTRKKNPGTVKISPWTLAHLNADEVSKVAAQARKKSRILQPVVKRDNPLAQETDSSYGSGSGRMLPRIDNRRKTSKRGRLQTGLPLEPLAKISSSATDSNGSDLAPEASTSLAPLQLEARSAFHTSRAMSSTAIVSSSPDSSLDSPDLHPFCVPSSGVEGTQGFTSLPSIGSAGQKGIQLSRSTSDGYEASGGEDSDRIPSRIVHRSSNWKNLLFGSSHVETGELKASSSGGLQANMRPL